MYSASERLIFGHGGRFYDPVLVYFRLEKATQGRFAELCGQLDGEDLGLATVAAEKLAKVVCFAFELGAPFDAATGLGVTMGEWSTILREFNDFCEKKNRPAAPLPTSPGPTGSAGTDGVSEGCPTATSSACG